MASPEEQALALLRQARMHAVAAQKLLEDLDHLRAADRVDCAIIALRLAITSTDGARRHGMNRRDREGERR